MARDPGTPDATEAMNRAPEHWAGTVAATCQQVLIDRTAPEHGLAWRSLGHYALRVWCLAVAISQRAPMHGWRRIRASGTDVGLKGCAAVTNPAVWFRPHDQPIGWPYPAKGAPDGPDAEPMADKDAITILKGSV